METEIKKDARVEVVRGPHKGFKGYVLSLLNAETPFEGAFLKQSSYKLAALSSRGDKPEVFTQVSDLRIIPEPEDVLALIDRYLQDGRHSPGGGFIRPSNISISRIGLHRIRDCVASLSKANPNQWVVVHSDGESASSHTPGVLCKLCPGYDTRVEYLEGEIRKLRNRLKAIQRTRLSQNFQVQGCAPEPNLAPFLTMPKRIFKDGDLVEIVYPNGCPSGVIGRAVFLEATGVPDAFHPQNVYRIEDLNMNETIKVVHEQFKPWNGTPTFLEKYLRPAKEVA